MLHNIASSSDTFWFQKKNLFSSLPYIPGGARS